MSIPYIFSIATKAKCKSVFCPQICAKPFRNIFFSIATKTKCESESFGLRYVPSLGFKIHQENKKEEQPANWTRINLGIVFVISIGTVLYCIVLYWPIGPG